MNVTRSFQSDDMAISSGPVNRNILNTASAEFQFHRLLSTSTRDMGVKEKNIRWDFTLFSTPFHPCVYLFIYSCAFATLAGAPHCFTVSFLPFRWTSTLVFRQTMTFSSTPPMHTPASILLVFQPVPALGVCRAPQGTEPPHMHTPVEPWRQLQCWLVMAVRRRSKKRLEGPQRGKRNSEAMENKPNKSYQPCIVWPSFLRAKLTPGMNSVWIFERLSPYFYSPSVLFSPLFRTTSGNLLEVNAVVCLKPEYEGDREGVTQGMEIQLLNITRCVFH